MAFDFITAVKLFINKPGEANLAYGTITIVDAIDLPFYLKQANNGQLFVSFTRIKKPDGEFKATVFLKNREISAYINQVVIAAYEAQNIKSQTASRTIDEVPDVKGIQTKPATTEISKRKVYPI